MFSDFPTPYALRQVVRSTLQTVEMNARIIHLRKNSENVRLISIWFFEFRGSFGGKNQTGFGWFRLKSDPTEGSKRLGRYDHLILWQLPLQCPRWMDKETFASIPKTLTLRELKLSISQPGFRTKSIIVITTLTDVDEFSKEDVAELYGYRWNIELDIRSLKCNLNLDHVRCKSPEMVRCELWTTILAYNLIRSTAAAAALLHAIKPRQISFTSTVQFVLQEWSLLAKQWIKPQQLLEFANKLLEAIANCTVADRPGRIEPRIIKRRGKSYKWMTQPRSILKAKLRHS